MLNFFPIWGNIFYQRAEVWLILVNWYSKLFIYKCIHVVDFICLTICTPGPSPVARASYIIAFSHMKAPRCKLDL